MTGWIICGWYNNRYGRWVCHKELVPIDKKELKIEDEAIVKIMEVIIQFFLDLLQVYMVILEYGTADGSLEFDPSLLPGHLFELHQVLPALNHQKAPPQSKLRSSLLRLRWAYRRPPRLEVSHQDSRHPRRSGSPFWNRVVLPSGYLRLWRQWEGYGEATAVDARFASRRHPARSRVL
jgi:hypothetical protein